MGHGSVTCQAIHLLLISAQDRMAVARAAAPPGPEEIGNRLGTALKRKCPNNKERNVFTLGRLLPYRSLPSTGGRVRNGRKNQPLCLNHRR